MSFRSSILPSALASALFVAGCPGDDSPSEPMTTTGMTSTGGGSSSGGSATDGATDGANACVGPSPCGTPCEGCGENDCWCDGFGTCVDTTFTCEDEYDGLCIQGDAGVPWACGHPCTDGCTTGACVCDGDGNCLDQARVTCGDDSTGSGSETGSGTGTGSDTGGSSGGSGG